MNFHFSTGMRPPDELLIELGGELTIFHASELRDRLVDVVQSLLEQQAIRLRLQRDTEMDTAGLQVLLSFQQALQQRGDRLSIEVREPAIRDLFELCQLELPLVPADEELQP